MEKPTAQGMILRQARLQWYSHLLACNVVTISQQWWHKKVCDSFWRLYVNFRSGAKYIYDGESYPFLPGKVYLLPAWVTFGLRAMKPVEHFYVHFDMVGPLAGVTRAFFSSPIICDDRPDLIQTSRELADAFKSKSYDPLASQCRISALVYESLSSAIEQLPEDTRKQLDLLSSSSHSILPAIHYIDSNLQASLRNDELANICCYSEDHFIREFSKCIGVTPARYVRQRRAAAAAQMLLFTNDSIDQIAEKTGFPNRYYFSRVFAQEIGQPPATYRKRGFV